MTEDLEVCRSHGHVHLRVLILAFPLIKLRLCVVGVKLEEGEEGIRINTDSLLESLACSLEPRWATYTCHLSGGEDARQQERFYRNSEDEDERKRQRSLGGHDGPQDGQTHQLDAGEHVHPQRADLEGQRVITQSDTRSGGAF